MATSRGLVSTRLPRSQWQVFQICLRRDGGTLQQWVERAIRTAVESGKAGGPGRPSGGARRQGGEARGRAASRSGKQIVLHVDADLLARLQALTGAGRGSVSGWIAQEIERYAASQR